MYQNIHFPQDTVPGPQPKHTLCKVTYGTQTIPNVGGNLQAAPSIATGSLKKQTLGV